MPYKALYPDLDIPKSNVLSYLFPQGQQASNRPIWTEAADPSNTLTKDQILLWIKRFAVGLEKSGIKKGSVVMVFSPNHIYVPIIYLGAAGAGRCFTGANPVYTANEVAHQMKTINAAAVFIHPSLLDTGLKAAAQAGIPKSCLFQFSDKPVETRDGISDWRTMLGSEDESRQWQWDPLDGRAATETIATINFSSGTTGLPKGVCITHYNLIANTMQAIAHKFEGTGETEYNYTPERWVAMLPLYHAFSQAWTINIALRMQVEVYVVGTFVFEDFLKYLEKYKSNVIQTVPPVMVMLAKRPETQRYDISHLKQIVCGGAPLKSDLQNEITKRFNLVVTQGWGMSETTCSGCMFPGRLNDTTGSIGHILRNTEAMLVDDDGNEVTTEGEPGELWVRGPQMLLSYWQNEKATRESLTADRWFKTGDVAITKEGKWWIVDRKKELIKVNGLQVAPAELESILLEHEGVADAAVTGIMLHGEELPIAYVVLQDRDKGKVTAQDIQDFMKGKVAKHKQLKGGVKFIDAVPKLASGKIIRKLMKEWAKRDQAEMEGQVKARL